MKQEKKLKKFNKVETDNYDVHKYKEYVPYINSYFSGEGIIGDNSYLILWNKKELESLNADYDVEEFLNDCILIGSDGGDIAYGINKNGSFFSVPFIGMCDEEKRYMGNTFDEFLEILYKL